MRKLYISIDNGVSGTVAFISQNGNFDIFPTPVKKELNYTKAKGFISRIDIKKLKDKLIDIIGSIPKESILILLERPMVNPGRFKASVSALRALEATLILVEELELSFIYVDSKQWQKIMLPSGLKGEELKIASKDVGCRLFPSKKDFIQKHKDADSLLMAAWAKKTNQ